MKQISKSFTDFRAGPHGDLEDLIEHYSVNNRPIPERFILYVAESLFQAGLTMKKVEKSDNGRQVVHRSVRLQTKDHRHRLTHRHSQRPQARQRLPRSRRHRNLSRLLSPPYLRLRLRNLHLRERPTQPHRLGRAGRMLPSQPHSARAHDLRRLRIS